MFGIDNWRRDFSTNQAATDPAAEDPDLRPLRVQVPTAALSERLAAWTAGKSHWTVEREQQERDGSVQMHLVRSTRLLRFKDDVHVTITPQPDGGALLEVASKSRIGRGDLGQNPRNIRELIRENRDPP